MVSVLVSVSDPETPKSILQRQLRMEARAGIGLNSVMRTEGRKASRSKEQG